MPDLVGGVRNHTVVFAALIVRTYLNWVKPCMNLLGLSNLGGRFGRHVGSVILSYSMLNLLLLNLLYLFMPKTQYEINCIFILGRSSCAVVKALVRSSGTVSLQNTKSLIDVVQTVTALM